MAADKPALELGLDFPVDARLHFLLGSNSMFPSHVLRVKNEMRQDQLLL